jgi:beta-lactam-binding protein with PASTA domain
VAVPAVEGAPLDRARKRLRRRGFEIEVARAWSNAVRRATVIEIAPGPGDIVPEGSPIVLTVSRGPRFERVRMPDVRGLAVAEARARLESLGLRVRVVHTGAGGSSVAETDPIAGSMQRENDLVALFV